MIAGSETLLKQHGIKPAQPEGYGTVVHVAVDGRLAGLLAIPALMLGLGGTLDLFAVEARRAPDFWIRHNLEWLYRGGLDPRRWSRLMQIPAFLWAVQRDARGRRA